MKCPYCGEVDSKVIDSRPTEDGEKIRRRRECLSCKKRFTTYEIVETVPLMVVKKDHSREVFDRQKLLNSMLRACDKRTVSYQQLDAAVSRIEQKLLNSYDREVTSITTCAALAIICVVSLVFKLDSIFTFALPLMFGMVSGVYSTICIATQLWVDWKERKAPADRKA